MMSVVCDGVPPVSVRVGRWRRKRREGGANFRQWRQQWREP